MRALPALVLALAACGGSGSDEPPPRPARGLPSLAATPAGPDDVVVAQVDGRPVWGSCVAAQARQRSIPDRAAALRVCIDFELLAQAAERRGLATAPEVDEPTRAALANRLVQVDFEARYRGPDDLRREIDRIVQANQHRMYRPELRRSVYVRVELPKQASAELAQAAKQKADEIYADLQGGGYLPPHLPAAAERHRDPTGKLKVVSADFRPATREALIDGYREALFGLAEVGQVAAPARTSEGWDIILLAEIIPERTFTREDIALQLFPDLRRDRFARWVDQLAKENKLSLSIDYEELKKLDEGDAPATPPTPPNPTRQGG
ncbi:MAG: peptidyl-prolyl cis-trans isomerase [Deltaproteobacteria bacterium]|nr:peptidyl-prolyl cis-trans isomerase [Deltaproteobacteria bacterium]